ncbi:IS701-like element ISAcma42 family transposase [Acaryochloris marina]|uniref:Transposase, IS4 family, putative n=2 Tax=Acaryochloris marina (strain MBIC 11017) TaxID=329726 RepID=B0CBZ8_ACAM1|nr:IS701-like element ISAcma42 family transposase [Acaryochloris marina]ABW25540.1 transposase, IS4 family, putative [Acaryochloris marina MBIC11017]
MRIPSKPSTAHCTQDLYVRYLLAQPKGDGCSHMAEILQDVSHDSINRFLLRERYEPKDLFDLLVGNGWVELTGGIVSADDTILEKLYSNPKKMDLLGYYWSSKYSKPILGIPLITLYYSSPNGLRVPINYRIYDKQEGKTKNQYLQEMLQEVLDWGLRPTTFTSDAWYASKANLNLLKDVQMGFLVGVAKNRQVRVGAQQYQRVDNLIISEQGLHVHLKGVGIVKFFCQRFKNGSCRYYLLYAPDPKELAYAGKAEFEHLHTLHWGIECFHRAGKQLCGLQRFRVRLTEAVHTHVFCALRAFVELELQVWHQQIDNWYALQRNLYQEVARQFILEQPLLGSMALT